MWFNNIDAYKKFGKLRDKLNAPKKILAKRFQPLNIYLWGESESGKSYFGKSFKEDFNQICYKSNEKYWNEYNNQDTLIINEFYGGSIDWSIFLTMTEKDETLVKRKYEKPAVLVAKYHIFTSNRSLESVMDFSNTEKSWFKDKKATLRRFKLPYGYTIRLEGSYPEGEVYWIFEEGDKEQFFKQELIIEFDENIKTIEEAQDYVYEEEYDRLFEKEGKIFLKKYIHFLNDNDEIDHLNDYCVRVRNSNYYKNKKRKQNENDYIPVKKKIKFNDEIDNLSLDMFA